jgi:hypothetical protein
LNRKNIRNFFFFSIVVSTGIFSTGCGSSSSGGTATVVATATATTTSLSSSTSSTSAGTNFTLTATVSPSAATGTVTFYNGSSSLGTATLSGGTATLTTSLGTAGTYSIAAVYGGSTGYSSSTSSTVALTIAASGSSGSAPAGTVVSVNSTAGTFVLQESDGTQILIDTVSGSTYQYTTATTASAAAIGGWVAAQGTVSGGQLNAVDLAFIPVPPTNIFTTGGTETVPQGTVYFGPITAIANGVLTIETSTGSEYIDTAAATNVTITTNSSFSAIAVGMAVEVNGPEVTATEYSGHQINLNGQPAVVGQFD